GGVWAARHWDEGTIADLKLAQQKAITRAAETAADVQKRQDAVTLNIALANAGAQERVRTVTRTILERVPIYVSPEADHACVVPNGFVRLFDAAAAGTDPASLPGTAGESDGAASGIALSEVAALSAEHDAQYHATAEQLKALEAWVEDQKQIANRE
ncbi:MAG TPA: hypothetical protein VMU22_02995, partial [Rhizomicrobium sp.]|nr:hypothetical protein [Rhizomicrobium sp.]